MKQYLKNATGIAVLLVLVASGAFAQQDNPDKRIKGKNSDNDIIIIRPKSGKDTKVTVEVKDGEVKVNGKPLSEFKDDNVTISRRKDGMGNVLLTPGSRFRSGAWSFNGDEFAPLEHMNDDRPFLGVSTEETQEGAKITDVTDESAAEKAGLKEDDIITAINDIKIKSPGDLTKAVGKFKPEEKITVTYKRDGKEQKTTATLGKRTGLMAFGPDSYKFNMGPLNKAYGFSYGGRQRLGIRAQETEDGKGIKVLDVDDESPADKAGLKEGDIITEFDGTEVNNVDKLSELSRTALAKTSFKIKVTRDGKPQELEVKIPKNLKTKNL